MHNVRHPAVSCDISDAFAAFAFSCFILPTPPTPSVGDEFSSCIITFNDAQKINNEMDGNEYTFIFFDLI